MYPKAWDVSISGWKELGGFNSTDSLNDFKSLKDGLISVNNLNNVDGGSCFYEGAIVRPELLLLGKTKHYIF